ncbi:LacI family transcriptional regulator [Amycolatopsis rubida]|uniref:LacI family transcriptional regulator n=2 Tax=Amycolatopsis rubida TaxID=112413 RepID=A0A1I5LQD2_9PSEU|nr:MULTISPECIES: LacI family DNA-binding transcriptional regulator [Amycolatopsis]MYW93510.1 substrate-binding domain-containing protein [Amycolatopsis rubida]NEC58497.1 LacI family transcriptional regulator [Amycolatopsis rubida]OAP25460.1 Ribose operon repressor [Amycolatopsis sp. M39]SFO99528.1 transcriptional regulator, LacI family [Amycolatopsis rubida]
MSITSHDVARLAGVSQPTVSRALRGDHRVSEATRTRVREAADALGYVPSEAGRSLATRSTHCVGVVVTDLTNPFYPHLIGPLHDTLEQHGYRMMLFAERSEAALETERLLDRSIDGVVLTTAVVGSALPAELVRRGVPFVFLNRETGTNHADAAVVDNEAGGRLVAEELLRLGHADIALIGGPADTTTGRDRELGFRVGLSEAGVGLPRRRVRQGPFDYDTGYAGLLDLWSDGPRPTAVFCGNDVIAIGAMNAARRLGLDIPGELTVIGFDDLPMASWETFDLTTVRHDLDGMAKAAADLLVERLSGTAPDLASRRTVFTPALVPRGTHAAR